MSKKSKKELEALKSAMLGVTPVMAKVLDKMSWVNADYTHIEEKIMAQMPGAPAMYDGVAVKAFTEMVEKDMKEAKAEEDAKEAAAALKKHTQVVAKDDGVLDPNVIKALGPMLPSLKKFGGVDLGKVLLGVDYGPSSVVPIVVDKPVIADPDAAYAGGLIAKGGGGGPGGYPKLTTAIELGLKLMGDDWLEDVAREVAKEWARRKEHPELPEVSVMVSSYGEDFAGTQHKLHDLWIATAVPTLNGMKRRRAFSREPWTALTHLGFAAVSKLAWEKTPKAMLGYVSSEAAKYNYLVRFGRYRVQKVVDL